MDNLVVNVVFSIFDIELICINFEFEGIVVGVGIELLYLVSFFGNVNVCYYFELDGGKEGFVNVLVFYIGDCLVGMIMDVYVMEDVIQFIYGMGFGLKIQDEVVVYVGVIYNDVNGNFFCGGCYVQEVYMISNVLVGMLDDSWKVELFIDNLFNELVMLNIDMQ